MVRQNTHTQSLSATTNNHHMWHHDPTISINSILDAEHQWTCELVEGNILNGNHRNFPFRYGFFYGFSCRISLQPIHWFWDGYERICCGQLVPWWQDLEDDRTKKELPLKWQWIPGYPMALWEILLEMLIILMEIAFIWWYFWLIWQNILII